MGFEGRTSWDLFAYVKYFASALSRFCLLNRKSPLSVISRFDRIWLEMTLPGWGTCSLLKFPPTRYACMKLLGFTLKGMCHDIFQELRQPKHVKYEPHTVCEIVLALKTRKLWSLYSLSVADSQSLVQCLRHKGASTVRRSLLHLIFYHALPSCCRRVTGRGYVKSGFQLPDEKEAEAKWGTTTMNWWNRLKAAILRWFQVKGINYTKLCCKVARRAGLDISVLSKFWQI